MKLFVHGICQGCGQPAEEHDTRDEQRCALLLFCEDES